MMLDRDKITFWTRVGAIALAVIFVGSFVLFGVGSNTSFSLFDLFGNQNQTAEQTTSPDEQINRSRADLEKNPDDPRATRRLAGLLIQAGRTDEAIQVLETGRKAAPEDPYLPLLLGQSYDRQAQALTDEKQRQTALMKAGDAYVAASEVQGADNRKAQAYLLAGQAYEGAGDKGNAIRYWNEYLRLEPEGQQAGAVKERIQALLKGGETTGAAGQ